MYSRYAHCYAYLLLRSRVAQTYLVVSGPDNLCTMEAGGELEQEAAEGFVAVEGAIVGANAQGRGEGSGISGLSLETLGGEAVFHGEGRRRRSGEWRRGREARQQKAGQEARKRRRGREERSRDREPEGRHRRRAFIARREKDTQV
jgi:hypothetical protein